MDWDGISEYTVHEVGSIGHYKQLGWQLPETPHDVEELIDV